MAARASLATVLAKNRSAFLIIRPQVSSWLNRRSKIDNAKIEMARAGDVIKLIAKITVASVCQQMDEQGYSTEKGD